VTVVLTEYKFGFGVVMMMMMLDLPVEILSEILVHLDHLSILRCSTVYLSLFLLIILSHLSLGL
jgi:F-box domain